MQSHFVATRNLSTFRAFGALRPTRELCNFSAVRAWIVSEPDAAAERHRLQVFAALSWPCEALNSAQSQDEPPLPRAPGRQCGRPRSDEK